MTKPFKNLFGSTLELKFLDFIITEGSRNKTYTFIILDIVLLSNPSVKRIEKGYKIIDKFVKYKILTKAPDPAKYYLINLDSPIVQAFQTINNFLNEEK